MLEVAAGRGVGLLGGLMGVGGGALMTPLLLLLFGVAPNTAVGNVQFGLRGLLLGAIPGVLLGARLCGHLPDAGLRALLASVLAFSALRLLR